jgi:hypothetical protein
LLGWFVWDVVLSVQVRCKYSSKASWQSAVGALCDLCGRACMCVTNMLQVLSFPRCVHPCDALGAASGVPNRRSLLLKASSAASAYCQPADRACHVASATSVNVTLPVGSSLPAAAAATQGACPSCHTIACCLWRHAATAQPGTRRARRCDCKACICRQHHMYGLWLGCQLA